MIAVLSRRRLRQLEATELVVESLRRDAWTLQVTVLHERTEKGLLRQALEKADADAVYWKSRAERFLDQIGLKMGIIVEPTMSEPPAPTVDKLEGVFAALGISELTRDKDPSPTAVATAPRVEGVDMAAAQAAIDATLADIGRFA